MKTLRDDQLSKLVEASIFLSVEPVSLDDLLKGVLAPYTVKKNKLKAIIANLQNDYTDRGVNLCESASGYLFQTALEISEPLNSALEEKTAKYSKAALETLAIIAYKQPTTKGEIEEIRGVSVSHPIIRSFIERGWIRTVGHKEVPGRPSLYGTTKTFLDDFNLKSLSDLPELEEKTLEDLSQKSLQYDLSLKEDTKSDKNVDMQDNKEEI